jgi:parallel beta-helix repeat protein
VRRLCRATALLVLGAATGSAAATLRVPSATYPDPATALLSAVTGDKVVVTGGSWGDLILTGGVIANGVTLEGKRGATFSTVVIDQIEDFVLRGFRITGNGGLPAVEVRGNALGVDVVRCLIEGGEIGISLAILGYAERNRIVGADTGIEMLGFGNSAFGNEIIGTPDWAIRVTGNNNDATRNRVESSGPIGVPEDATGDLDRFEGNEIVDALEDGIVLGGAMNHAFKNRVSAPGKGIYVTGEGGHSVIENRVTGADEGIQLKFGDGNRIEGNRVRDSVDDGIDVETSGNQVIGNKISEAGGSGIELEEDAYGPPVGNLFEANRVAGATGDSGFRIEEGGNTFQDNRATGNAPYDLHDSSGGGNSYSGNRFGSELIE